MGHGLREVAIILKLQLLHWHSRLHLAADDASLELAQKSDIAVADGSASNEQLAVEMGMLLLEASFGSLAWPGVYARTRITPFGAIIHAQIVGAQVGS